MKFEGGHKTFIIAEVGSNWASLEDCLYSIRSAKAMGADAVKFQLYNYGSLFGLPIPQGYLVSAQTGCDMPGALNRNWLPQLKSQADHVGIEFMCSAFSPELYDVVNPFVNIHKVASAELSHVRILEKLNGYGKPVILSTGASGVSDINAALSFLYDAEVMLMYCVASYPAKELNLENIKGLSTLFSLPCGFSDHSTDACVIPRAAVDRGAVVVEKHVQFVDGVFPDTPHSLNADQFKLMVDSIRTDKGPVLGFTREEQDMLTRHNRRLIAIKDIKIGDTLRENENFGIFRSLHTDSHAFSPFAISGVGGKTALRNINAGFGIGPGDV